MNERGQLAEIGDRLTGAAERLLAENLKELGKVFAAELLEIIRGRLGANFGQAIRGYIKKLREDFDETLALRLASAADASVADVLPAFAQEVVEFAEGRRIALSFDSGERLNDEEARLLVDVAERLPEGCHARVAFVTDGALNRERVRQLRILGPSIYEIEVGPLSEEAVAAWLSDAGLMDLGIAQVVRATGAYPLHVGDLVRDLQRGGRLGDLPLNEQIALRVEASWQNVPIEVAAVARKLCVLPDPLPQPRLRELLALDAAAFGEAVATLEEARIFPTRVDGQPWFHEQRRAFVLAKLGQSERDEAATAAADIVWEEFKTTGDRRWVALFTTLAEQAKTLQAREPMLREVLALDEPALATMAALVELMTPENRGAAEGDVLFRHARRFTQLDINPLAIVASLESAELVATASNDYATVIVPTLTDRALAAIEGAAFLRLQRTPIPELTWAAFQLGIRTRLDDFDIASFGIGRPSIGSLSRVALGGDPSPGLGRTGPNRRDGGSHILARGRYAERPMWLVASYDDRSPRDRAIADIESLSVEVLGEALTVQESFPHPLEVVPTQRFANAGARAFDIGSLYTRRRGELRIELPQPLSHEQGLQLRVETAQLLRRRASSLERYAMELDQTFGIYWDAGDSWSVECVMSGSEERAVRVAGLLAESQDDRYRFFRLEQRLALSPDAALDHVSVGYGRSRGLYVNDPVMAEIGRRRTKAALFNSGQPKRRVAVEQTVIEEMVREGFLRQMEDARALQPISARPFEPLPPTALYVYVLLEPPDPGWVAGAGADVIVVERLSESGHDEAHVASSQGGVDFSGIIPAATGPTDGLFTEAFGFTPDWRAPEILGGSRGMLDALLVDYAGFDEDDLDLRWPQELDH